MKPKEEISNSAVDSLISFILFKKTTDTKLQVHMQKVKLAGRSFLINEIYGMDIQETET
jgi:hypothetical protein